LSRVANTYWVDERIQAQRVVRKPAAASMPLVQQISAEIIGSRSDVRRRGGVIPSWVVFGMIILATFGVCVTVNMRTRTKVQFASEQFALMQSDVETLRNVNRALQTEVERLRNDPRAIELAARKNLNMVRSNEFIVPIE